MFIDPEITNSKCHMWIEIILHGYSNMDSDLLAGSINQSPWGID